MIHPKLAADNPDPIAVLRDTTNRVGDTEVLGIKYQTWTDVSFNTGWANRGSGFGDIQYRLVDDIVYLRGLARRTSGTAIVVFTLPTGFRPDRTMLLVNYVTFDNTTLQPNLLFIRSNGNVEVDETNYTLVNNQNEVSLDNIQFSLLAF